MKIKLPLILLGITLAIFASWWLLSGWLNKVMPLGYLRVAIDTNWKPLQLYNREQNVSLFSEDLLRAIAENQNFSFRIIHVGSDFLYTGLLNQDFDAILSFARIPTDDHPREFIISEVYFPLGPVVVATTTSTIKSIEDLNGKKIAFIMGSEASIPLYENTAIHFVPYSSVDLPKIIEDLIMNNIDGAILNQMLAKHVADRGIYKDDLDIVSLPLNKDGLAMIAKNTPESKKIIEKFNQGLKAIQKNGTYDQLLQKWDFPAINQK